MKVWEVRAWDKLEDYEKMTFDDYDAALKVYGVLIVMTGKYVRLIEVNDKIRKTLRSGGNQFWK